MLLLNNYNKLFFKKIGKETIIEIPTLKQPWNEKVGKSIGYYEGRQGNKIVMHSPYQIGNSLYDGSAGNGSYVPSIKSIRILGEK